MSLRTLPPPLAIPIRFALAFALALAGCSGGKASPPETPAPSPSETPPATKDPGAVQDQRPLQPSPPPGPEGGGSTAEPGQQGQQGQQGQPGATLRPDGASCLAAAECASGICEGQGCTDDRPGTCAPRSRACTRDLRQYCGCDGKTFGASGICPGRRFSARAPCGG